MSDKQLTPELIEARDNIKKIAQDFGLDFFETIFELVDSNQINSLAAFGGFPVRYPHWRFGMDYDQLSKGYTWGLQKIYEMVINTDPSYAYLVSSNAHVDQKMVMAHVYGHVDFFKNNIWFSKTDRKMLDTMANNAVRVRAYMDQYGQEVVENFIDRCLSIENLIDAFLPFQEPKKTEPPPSDVNAHLEVGKIKTDRPYMDRYLNPPEFMEAQKKKMSDEGNKQKRNPPEPVKDVLLFLLQNAKLTDWEHDVLSIVRDEAYYFVPQMQTKIMNEGWASYWHSTMMTTKVLNDSEILDYACNHAGTMAMGPGKINPYKIGIELFRDIEDRWNRGAFGKEYDECDDMIKKAKWDKKLGKGREKIFEVRRVCNDITFIDEYFTQEFCDRLKLYTYEFNKRTNQYEIVDRDFRKVREKLLAMLTNFGQPFIFVKDANFENRGELLLWHKHQGFDLDLKYAKEVLTNMSAIWKRPVSIETEIEGQKKIWTIQGNEFIERGASQSSS